MKKIISIFLCFIILSSAAFAADGTLFDTAFYLEKTITDPTVASIGGEWAVIGLAKSGVKVSEKFFEKYYQNVQAYVKSKEGVLHSRKYTEYSRVILALCAIGKNPENVCGYNLVTPLYDVENTVKQGVNGAIWALIALDCNNYGNKQLRKEYISHILSAEKKNGGWALSSDAEEGDVDITAMALTALSNYSDDKNVSEAIERGIEFLSKMQNQSGGYFAYGIETSESAAQVICALSSLGIYCDDERFVKNGISVFDNLMTFRQSDGSFAHIDQKNLMATEQCFYALVAKSNFEQGKSKLFNMNVNDFTDEKIEFDNKENIDKIREITKKISNALRGAA